MKDTLIILGKEYKVTKENKEWLDNTIEKWHAEADNAPEFNRVPNQLDGEGSQWYIDLSRKYEQIIADYFEKNAVEVK